MFSRFNIIAIILIVAAAAIGVFLVWPKYQEGLETQVKIERMTTKVQNQKEYFEDLEAISEKLEGYTNQFKIMADAFPSEPNLPLLYDFFQKFSSRKGLMLMDIGISDKSGEGSVKEISIHLGVLGNYDSFKDDFLPSLERSARFFKVESISFSSPKDFSPFGFNIDLKTQYKDK